MRYIDSGSRDPDQALGTWLIECGSRAAEFAELRWQSGFFGEGSLAFLAPLIARVREIDGALRVLVGSNEGGTRSQDLESLLTLVGPARPNLSVGVVSYGRGFFHPKTIHLTRQDGLAAAYVGSANLTGDGVRSLHVEAGVLLDTADGDDAAVLDDIAASVDAWFAPARSGLYVVRDSEDLPALVAAGILDTPRPAVPRGSSGGGQTDSRTRLAPLVSSPPASEAPSEEQVVANPEKPVGEPPPPPAQQQPHVSPVVVAEWRKVLTRSDAQRKATGHQRGSVTLVQAGYDIDAQTYFRFTFFSTAGWIAEPTRTGEVRESATVDFVTEVLGTHLGIQQIQVSYASNRAADQANYTSLLHLGPLAEAFAIDDMTGRSLTLRRLSNGAYVLSIA